MRSIPLGLAVALVACGSSDAPSDDGAGGSTTMINSGAESNAGAAGSPGVAGSVVTGGPGTTVTGSAGASGAAGGTGGAGGRSGGMGATGANGGNASGDASVPHVVMPCPSVAAGPWEDITPAAIKPTGQPYQGGAGAVLVNPKDPRTVYVGGANGGGLYKSTDCGASFVHVNSGAHSSDVNGGKIWDMAIDNVNPDTLYLIEGYGAGGLWKTTNGGVDFQNVIPNDSEVGKTANANFASIVSIDITDHQHLVVAFHSGCSGAYAPNCQAETKDGGATWRLLKAPTGGEGVGVIVLGATTWISGAYQAMYETTDSGASWNKVSDASAHWQLYASTSGALYVGTMSGILKSTDGKAWSLLPGFHEQVQGITGDGVDIFAGQQFQPKYFKVPEANPAGFSQIGPTHSNSAYFMSFDPDHKLLYASEMSTLWRSVQN